MSHPPDPAPPADAPPPLPHAGPPTPNSPATDAPVDSVTQSAPAYLPDDLAALLDRRDRFLKKHPAARSAPRSPEAVILARIDKAIADCCRVHNIEPDQL